MVYVLICSHGSIRDSLEQPLLIQLLTIDALAGNVSSDLQSLVDTTPVIRLIMIDT